jgi:hypothetical protein
MIQSFFHKYLFQANLAPGIKDMEKKVISGHNLMN